ncbi:MAG: conjugal transfer protein TraR [Clostridiales bacterium]|nr:conjugal transfer protein TraR [Clostridiales bacterium]
MEKKQTDFFKDLLLKEKETKEKSLYTDKIGLGASIKDDSGELSSYDNHPGELGSATFEAEKNISFRKNYKTIINMVNDAIRKIDEGKYGECEECGKSIDFERLRLIPYTKYCQDCEKIHDEAKEGDEKKRPIEEEVLMPPFGKSFRDNSIDDNVQFDGEDAWQAVNVYNVITSDNPFSKEDSMGYVEDVEQISNEKYKKQIE